MNNPLLKVDNLKLHFPVKSGLFHRTRLYNRAVDGVNLHVNAGETLGLVGESGCGKTSLGRCIARLYKPTSGKIQFDGREISSLTAKAMLPIRQDIQMIFQDPMESLNARHTVGDILEEPLIIHKTGRPAARQQRIRTLLDIVGLPSRSISRYPFEFSGGQRQRIGIARAIEMNPKLIICDEPVSALDVSIQSQILNLLIELQQEYRLSYLFIAHDLAVVKHVSDRIAIMYLGKIIEEGPSEQIYAQSMHPYTKSLINAIPIPDPHQKPEREIISGDVPSPINPPGGCRFHPRCPEQFTPCAGTEPITRILPGQHQVSCHLTDRHDAN